MENINRVSSKVIEIEISIKLFEYLKRETVIDDRMYSFCIDKLIRKLELEKKKQDDNYINNISNYKILI